MELLLFLLAFLVTGSLLLADQNFHYDAKFDGIPAAYGDFNSDKFTDIFVVSTDGLSFTVLKGDKRNPYLYEDKQLRCSVGGSKRIVGLVLADFRGKAVLDVVVIVNENSNENLFSLYLVDGNKTNLSCEKLQAEPFASVKNHPLLLDINGDMVGDLFAEGSDGKRYFWLGQESGNFTKVQILGTLSNPLLSPSSNAFIDIDGDMTPDLFVAGHSHMEYWLAPKLRENEKRITSIPYPGGYARYGESTFVDLNADGVIDHLLPVCKDEDCKSSGIVAWRQPSWVNLTSVMPDSGNSSATLSYVLTKSPVGPFVIPLKLREADVDGDGFPDLIALLQRGKQRTVFILQNIPDQNNAFQRSFKPMWEITANLPENALPILASFFDLKEDGRADVMVAAQTSDDPSKILVTSVLNTQMVDACFLKVLVASGLCYSRCPPSDRDGEAQSTAMSYGTNQAGPSVLYELVDTEGHKRKGAAGQLSQSANFALQMPYSIFGLGQQPNFVDNLTASIPSGAKHIRKQSWPQIIPDSQVVVIPYPPDSPSHWRSRLFITPSDIVISTLITLTSICCLLVVIIAVLHRKEALEDLEEHEEYKRHWPESR